MSNNSRLLRFESVTHGRDLALLWLITAQGKSRCRDRWETSYFEPWVSENEEAGLHYHLANELNCAVIAEAHQWRLVVALLGASMLNSKPNSELTMGKESLNNLPKKWKRCRHCSPYGKVYSVTGSF